MVHAVGPGSAAPTPGGGWLASAGRLVAAAGGDTAPAKQQCSRAAQRPKLGAATDTEEFDLAARTQENFPLRAKRIPPCAEGDDPLAIQLQQ